MKILSLICARSRSEGLKDKCILKIAGKMVIEYSIDYSLSLGNCVDTVVSTNIQEIIEFCKMKNIDYIIREEDLCSSDVRIEKVIVDAIDKKGQLYDYISLVYGNIPTRYPWMFKKAVEILCKNSDLDAVISMQEVGKFNPEWMFDYSNTLLPHSDTQIYRRQCLPKKMIHDGHTLVFRANRFYKKMKDTSDITMKSIYSAFGDKIKPLINDEVIIDIDTEKDYRLAEAFLSSRLKDGSVFER